MAAGREVCTINGNRCSYLNRRSAHRAPFCNPFSSGRVTHQGRTWSAVVQVASSVTFCVVPSVITASAVKAFSSPTGTEVLTGVTTMLVTTASPTVNVAVSDNVTPFTVPSALMVAVPFSRLCATP